MFTQASAGATMCKGRWFIELRTPRAARSYGVCPASGAGPQSFLYPGSGAPPERRAKRRNLLSSGCGGTVADIGGVLQRRRIRPGRAVPSAALAGKFLRRRSSSGLVFKQCVVMPDIAPGVCTSLRSLASLASSDRQKQLMLQLELEVDTSRTVNF